MPSPTELVASYRLQLTPDFGFDQACVVMDYLATIGISHVYLSPVAEAVPGSTHGYDVVDLNVLWDIIEDDLPPLVAQLHSILGEQRHVDPG